MVSIIIPVYQAEAFLAETINSVINQTYEQWELLLIDDGSSDSSGIICDNFSQADNRIKSFHKENGGQSSARNYGLSIAQGDYIYMMDNDDIITEDAIRILVNLIEKYNTDIAACSYNIIDEKGNITHNYHTNKIEVYDNNNSIKLFLDRTIDVYVWTKLYKKDFLKRNNFLFEEKRSDEDFLFNIQTFRKTNGVVVYDYPIYQYKERIASTCRQFPKQKLLQYIDDTLYRTQKIENIINTHYPQFTFLANRQTIDYSLRLIGAIIENNGRYNQTRFYEIAESLHHNKKQAIKERKLWGMSYWGILFATSLHPFIYYMTRKLKHRLQNQSNGTI